MQPVFSFFGFLAKVGAWLIKFLPLAFTGIILFVTLFNSLITSINEKDASIFIKDFSTSIFAADCNINQQVELAKTNPDEFGIKNLLIILSSLLIIYYLSKFIGKLLIGFIGAQAAMMAYVAGFVIVAILEMSVVAFIEDEFIYPMSGIVNLISNFNSVFTPDLFRPFQSLQEQYLYNQTNVTSNST